MGPVKLGQLNDWKLYHEDQRQHIWGVPKMENTQKHGFKRLNTKTVQFIWNDLGVPISGDLIWIHLGDHPLMVKLEVVDPTCWQSLTSGKPPCRIGFPPPGMKLPPWLPEPPTIAGWCSGFFVGQVSFLDGTKIILFGSFLCVGSQWFVGYIMAIWYISWLFGYSFYIFLLCPILILHYFLYQRFIPALAADLL